jgi:hypothetical protein
MPMLTLHPVDGVCSVASEDLQMEEWGVDVVLTASQKGLGMFCDIMLGKHSHFQQASLRG